MKKSNIIFKNNEINRSDIYLAGVWPEGLETQETATNSRKKVAEKVKLFLEPTKK